MAIVEGNDPEHCIQLFHVLTRKDGLAVVFDGSSGRIQIYRKGAARWNLIKRKRNMFVLFDPDKDGRDAEINASRWWQAAGVLSKELKDRGLNIKILANPVDQCIFTKIFPKTYVLFDDIIDALEDGSITLEYGAEQAGMTRERFLEALKQVGVDVARFEAEEEDTIREPPT